MRVSGAHANNAMRFSVCLAKPVTAERCDRLIHRIASWRAAVGQLGVEQAAQRRSAVEHAGGGLVEDRANRIVEPARKDGCTNVRFRLELLDDTVAWIDQRSAQRVPAIGKPELILHRARAIDEQLDARRDRCGGEVNGWAHRIGPRRIQVTVVDTTAIGGADQASAAFAAIKRANRRANAIEVAVKAGRTGRRCCIHIACLRTCSWRLFGFAWACAWANAATDEQRRSKRQRRTSKNRMKPKLVHRSM